MEFTVQTHQFNEIIDITSMVNARIPKTLKCGICHIFCPHTTAGLTINENADPDVKHDLLAFYRHGECNSDAHLKAMLTGFSLAVPVVNGELHLGTWQGIYFCEYDGPRTRMVELFFQRAEN